VVHVPHTFTVTVVAKKVTYAGSTTLEWTF